MSLRSQFDGNYFEFRRCLREPIPEIFEAAYLLDEAANTCISGKHEAAQRAIVAADIPVIRDWVESLWGRKEQYPEKPHHLRLRPLDNMPDTIPKDERVVARRPSGVIEIQLISKFGWNCTYCGIPLLSRDARDILRGKYPNEVRWGTRNDEKHVAFLCLDNEFDHVVPHSRGGTSDKENLVTCCAPCNCAKEAFTLEQLGLIDPRDRFTGKAKWDGLTRLHD